MMLRAAQLYYFEELTQAAIADRLGCTRWTVGRLLEDARRTGMVTITITHPRARDHDLEVVLEDALGLDRAIVVPTPASPDAVGKVVVGAAADHLAELRPLPRRMAVAWGRTMAMVARAMPDRWTHDLMVFQVNGGLARSNDDVTHSIGLMAKRGHGVGYTIPAPTIVRDPELGRRLRREPSVAATMHSAAHAEIAMFSPGAPEADSVLVRSGYLGGDDLSLIRSKGAVADIFSHFVDASGSPVWDELEDRTIAVALEHLRGIRNRIVIGWGPLKVVPLVTTVRAGFANVLITDVDTAEQMLAVASADTDDTLDPSRQLTSIPERTHP